MPARSTSSRRASSWALRALAAAAIVSVGYGAGKPSAVTAAQVELAPGTQRVWLTAAEAAKLPTARGRARPVRSILNVRGPMDYGDYVWEDRGVPAGRLWIRVDREAQLISVFRGQHEIGTAVIVYGATEKPTPSGTYPIIWRRADHRSSLYDAPMPYTLRITGDGVAIHGSDVRRGRATHGCVGVPIEFARKLFAAAKLGDPVDII